MFKNLQCHLQFENDLRQSLFDSDRQLIKQCYFSLEIKHIKITWGHVKKQLFPLNADQAQVHVSRDEQERKTLSVSLELKGKKC